MKKFLTRTLGMVVTFIGLCRNFCYADIIDPGKKYVKTTSDIQPMIIIGIVIVAIVAASIIVLVKSKKNKNEKVSNEE